jgi:hypothetical protein
LSKRLDLYLSFCSGGLCKDLNKSNIIWLDEGFNKDFIVTGYVTVFVKVLVFVDIEWRIDEFALVRIPNLS